jgi:hypothetical protein
MAPLLGGMYRKTGKGVGNVLRQSATLPAEAWTGVQQHTHILRINLNSWTNKLLAVAAFGTTRYQHRSEKVPSCSIPPLASVPEPGGC